MDFLLQATGASVFYLGLTFSILDFFLLYLAKQKIDLDIDFCLVPQKIVFI